MNIRKISLSLLLLSTTFSFAQTNPEIENKIDEILPQLTIKEKVALCHAQSKFSSPGVSRLGIPEIWMADGPHGVRAEINWDNWGYAGWTNDAITAFPALTCLAATFDPDLAYQYGSSIGEEARYREKDVLLGPGVNIYRTPLNGRNFEYMGEDPCLASTMVVPYIKGVQKNGVASCVKHYVLNNQELWRGHINVEVSDRALHEIYLPAFRAAVMKAGVWSIMGAYNQYHGQFCCHNDTLLNKILKEDWGFDGVVITDWGGAHDTKQAALYGLDIEMGSWTNGLTSSVDLAYDNYYLATPFYDMIIEGEVDESVLDEKVRRILRLIFRTAMNLDKPWGSLNTEAHQKTAYDVATNGIVLLKNDSIFPIARDTDMKIAVIGENATRSVILGGGSSDLKAQYEISPLVGIKNCYTNAAITYAMGYSSGSSAYGCVNEAKEDQNKLLEVALETAKNADVVLFVGGLNKNNHQDCEGADRTSYNLPFNQDSIIYKIAQVNPNIGVVLVSGNAVATPWIDNVRGVMQAWYCGNEAGHAIADVVAGVVNPSGKLPFSFPIKLEDNAAHSFGKMSYPGDSINVEYKEGIFVGYRWFDTQKIKPAFAFGYGLSYTQFEISDVAVNRKEYLREDSIEISCTLSNTGAVDGAEVVQVYVGKSKSKVERALKELKGFKKVFVPAGQQQNVKIKVPISDLKYYDEDLADWKLEDGKYVVYVGNSSDNISEKLSIKVD